MSDRPAPALRDRLLAWLLLATSTASIAALNWGLITRLDKWTATPFAVLAHSAILPAVAACGVTWRMPPSALRTLSRVLAALVLIAWLHTWFGPLQKLAAWISIQWYLWMGT
jgi:hypothetical protein